MVTIITNTKTVLISYLDALKVSRNKLIRIMSILLLMEDLIIQKMLFLHIMTHIQVHLCTCGWSYCSNKRSF